MIQTIRAPRQVVAGAGAAASVADICAQHGCNILLVTDRSLVDQAPVAAVIGAVGERCDRVTVFADATPDVPLSDVDAAVAAIQDSGADALLAIGGGTVIDLAKIAGVVRRYGGSPRDYYGECLVPGPTMPLIAVPTTAGTGSEVSPVSVLSDPDRELKVGVSSVHLVPDVAVVDPELTGSCPPRVTAYSGADALCHAVESFTAAEAPADPVNAVFTGRNPVTDDVALRALRAIGPNLARAVRDGSDRAARAQMSAGATWAGLAFSHAGTACPHALQYPIGAATGTPHGLGVGLLLPYALTAVRDTVADRLAVLGECVGLEVDPTDPPAAAGAFIDWVVELLDEISVPRTLADIGLERADLPRLAEKATAVTRLLRNHPGPTGAADLQAILEAAWTGDRERLLRPAVAG